MVCLPLLERELRVALRVQKPAQARLKIAAVAAAGSTLILLSGAFLGGRQGKLLGQLVCLAGAYCILRTPQLTAGLLAEERRNQTLGLLYISGLSIWEVFASKFLVAALIAFTYLLALVPMMALPFLTGGVSFELFLATAAGLPTLMLFVLSMSLLASVLARDETGAIALCFVLITVICSITPAIVFAQSHFAANSSPSTHWLLLSPAFGPRLVWRGLRTGFDAAAQAGFWRNIVVTLAWSVVALGTAGALFRRVWREMEHEGDSASWRQRIDSWVHGSRQRRRRLAQQWLDLNPYAWAASRDRQPATLAWMLISGIVLLWLLCWACWPAAWPSVANSFITATVLNSVVAWLRRHTAAETLGLDRRDGAFEVLLSTPLTPSEIVQGSLTAIRIHFHRLATLVLVLNAVLLIGCLATRNWTGPSLAVYGLVSATLLAWSWRLRRDASALLPVMWASLICGRPALAVWKASGFNTWSWIWILFNLHSLGRGLREFPTGSIPEIVIVSVIALVFFALWYSNFRAQRTPGMKRSSKLERDLEQLRGPSQLRLVKEFRDIVQDPLPDPKDPRFKEWDVKERFP